MFLWGAAATLALFGIVALVAKSPLPLKPESAEVTIPWLPETVRRWDNLMVEMGKKYNIDPDVLAIITTLESGGYTRATSQAEARGLMQVTPATGQDIAKKYLKEPRESYDLYDPRTNIEFGAAYLAYLRDEFGEPNQGPSWNATVELIAAGYNGGPGNAGKLYRGEGLTSSETVIYSRDAYNMWRERHAKTSPTFDRWVERGGSILLEKARAEQQ